MYSQSESGRHEENNGKIHEHMLVGDVTRAKNSIPYQAALKSAIDQSGIDPKTQRLPYDAAVELVKHIQPDSPEAPRKKFPRDFREAVERQLQKILSGTSYKVMIYSAIGTPLDWYGIDGFITIEDNLSHSEMITFDVTISDRKITERNTKAHIIIDNVPDPIEEEAAYNAAVEKLAREVVVCYQSKISHS